MRDGLEDLEAALGKLRVEELGESGPEGRVLVHDHHGLRSLAGRIVEGDEIVECAFRDNAKAWAEAEGVLETARHDRVGDADVDHVGQVVARRRLARCEANG